MKTTFMMIKPDGVQRNLVGKIIQRIEEKGLQLSALKMIQIDQDRAEKHYEQLKDKDFFTELCDFITSSPVVVMAITGNDAVEIVRMLSGATKPEQSLPGTIRGDFSIDVQNNVVHTSDNAEHAKRELELYFDKEEIISYNKSLNIWCNF